MRPCAIIHPLHLELETALRIPQSIQLSARRISRMTILSDELSLAALNVGLVDGTASACLTVKTVADPISSVL